MSCTLVIDVLDKSFSDNVTASAAIVISLVSVIAKLIPVPPTSSTVVVVASSSVSRICAPAAVADALTS